MNIRRTFFKVVATLMLAAVITNPAMVSAAGVNSEWVGYYVSQGTWVPYNDSFFTDAWPHRVSFNKTDGPGLNLRIRGCSGYEWAGYGNVVGFPNPDPTGHIRLRETKDYPLRFCLNAQSLGSNSTDTFSGELSYWVSWL